MYFVSQFLHYITQRSYWILDTDYMLICEVVIRLVLLLVGNPPVLGLLLTMVLWG